MSRNVESRRIWPDLMDWVVRPAGLEPATLGLEGR
jgi:hypothetical protein